MRLETRRQVAAGIARWSCRASCLLGAAGVAASLSLLFLPAGIALIALAAATLVVGLGASFLVPRALNARPLVCPLCGTTSWVSRERQWWHCDGCSQVVVRAPNGKSIGIRTILTR